MIAQQTEIEYNSDTGAAGPQLLIQEANDAGDENGEDGWARMWFKNTADPANRWGFLARPQFGATDNPDSLLSPLVMAYTGIQKFGFGRDGTLRINKKYSFPNVDGTNGQVLTTDGSGNVTWADGGTGATSKTITQAISAQDLNPGEHAAAYKSLTTNSFFVSNGTPILNYTLPIPVGGTIKKVSLIGNDNVPGSGAGESIRMELFHNKTIAPGGVNSIKIATANSSDSGGINNYGQYNIISTNTLAANECFFVRIFADDGTGFPGNWPGANLKISKIVVEYDMP